MIHDFLITLNKAFLPRDSKPKFENNHISDVGIMVGQYENAVLADALIKAGVFSEPQEAKK